MERAHEICWVLTCKVFFHLYNWQILCSAQSSSCSPVIQLSEMHILVRVLLELPMKLFRKREIRMFTLSWCIFFANTSIKCKWLMERDKCYIKIFLWIVVRQALYTQLKGLTCLGRRCKIAERFLISQTGWMPAGLRREAGLRNEQQQPSRDLFWSNFYARPQEVDLKVVRVPKNKSVIIPFC